MNIEAAAKLIMSARHSDAFTYEACEKILRDAYAPLKKERDDLEAALRRLMNAVNTHLLCGVPEIKTVDDVIRGMRNISEKLLKVAQPKPES